MDITPLVAKGRQVINRYGNGGFVVNNIAYKGNILLMPESVLPWPVATLADAGPESFAAFFVGEPPEIVLIGAGALFTLLSAPIRAAFRDKGIAVDVMDTGAACRTHTVLVAEGRSVAAALIAV